MAQKIRGAVSTRSATEQLAPLLQRFPWSETQRRKGKPLEFCWHFDATFSASALWPHVANSSRVYRYLRLPEVLYTEQDGQLIGSSSYWGVPMHWVEYPWEWVDGRYLVCRREYDRGLAHYFRSIVEFVDRADGGCDLLIYFGWIPRGAASRMMLKLLFPKMQRLFSVALGRIESYLDGPDGRLTPFPARDVALLPGAAKRIDEIAERLFAVGQPASCVNALCRLLRESDELELARLQPKRLALSWDMPLASLLEAMLVATRHGLLTLSWDVMCPHCRGVRSEHSSLRAIPARSQCDVCAVDFTTDTRHAIEVTFRVHPAIRSVQHRSYCAAEPSTKPHIKLQQTLSPGQRAEHRPLLAPGGYRLRAVGRAETVPLEIASEHAQSTAHWRIGPQVDADLRLTAGAHPTVIIENHTAAPLTVVCEEMRWADFALDPAALFVQQRFHDLFSDELLAVGTHLDVGERTVAVLRLPDVVTRFRKDSDAAALAALQEAHDRLVTHVASAGGAVIKVHADTVVAVFADPGPALATLLGLIDTADSAPAIGLHCGPCIAITAAGALDIFGKTVLASYELCAAATPGTCLVSDRLLSDSPNLPALPASEATTQPILGEPWRVHRFAGCTANVVRL